MILCMQTERAWRIMQFINVHQNHGGGRNSRPLAHMAAGVPQPDSDALCPRFAINSTIGTHATNSGFDDSTATIKLEVPSRAVFMNRWPWGKGSQGGGKPGSCAWRQQSHTMHGSQRPPFLARRVA